MERWADVRAVRQLMENAEIFTELRSRQQSGLITIATAPAGTSSSSAVFKSEFRQKSCWLSLEPQGFISPLFRSCSPNLLCVAENVLLNYSGPGCGGNCWGFLGSC